MQPQFSSSIQRHLGGSVLLRGVAPLIAVYLLMLLGAALGLQTIAQEVDRSDSVRAKEAVDAAFNYQFSRLEMVTMNNAIYTEAWKAVGGRTVNKTWAFENWTVAPPDLPGHHGILLVEPDGTPVVGTRAGRPMSGEEMAAMAQQVRSVVNELSLTGSSSARGLINTGKLPIMVAVANVMPEPNDNLIVESTMPRRSLALVHPINEKLLATMNETIGGERLKLGTDKDDTDVTVIPAKLGKPVVLTWRSRQPGRAAMIRSLATTVPIIALVTIWFLIALKSQIASNKALNDAARTDYLTRLPNRAEFAARLERKIAQAIPFTIGLIDLDGFKKINDKHGHIVGDRLLQAFAETLRQVAEGQDFVARLGGDEFAFIVVDEKAAERLSLRLQLRLTQPIQIGTLTLAIGASVGLAQGSDSAAAEDILSIADTALYSNKRQRAPQPDRLVGHPAGDHRPDGAKSVGEKKT